MGEEGVQGGECWGGGGGTKIGLMGGLGEKKGNPLFLKHMFTCTGTNKLS